MDKSAKKGCSVLLYTIAKVQKDEKIVIVTDEASKEVEEIMYSTAVEEFPTTTMVMMKSRSNHGEEPTDAIAASMAEADVIFSITAFSLYSTDARRNACKNGARFVNMADYAVSMLEEGCLFVDFNELSEMVNDMAGRIEGTDIRLTTQAGTDFKCKINGRKALKCDAYITDQGAAGSPPNFEAAIGPTDGTSEGVLVIDASVPFPGVGVLKEPMKMTVEKGYITKIEGGEQAKILDDVLKSYNDESVFFVAEVGCGLNKGASISGRMLEDEGVYGTVHIGIGDNLSFGGNNKSPSHIDAIMYNPTMTVDGELVYKNGEIV